MQGSGELPWDVTCRGVVDGIAIVIHMTRREGRRFVEEAAVVRGYDAGTTTWDIHRLDHVTVQGRVARTGGPAAGGDARVRPYTTNQGQRPESCEFIR